MNCGVVWDSNCMLYWTLLEAFIMPAAIGLATVGLGDIWKDEHSVFNGKLEIIVVAIHSNPHDICV